MLQQHTMWFGITFLKSYPCSLVVAVANLIPLHRNPPSHVQYCSRPTLPILHSCGGGVTYVVTKGSSKDGRRLCLSYLRWLPANPTQHQKYIGHKYQIECTTLQDPIYLSIQLYVHLNITYKQLVGIPFSKWHTLGRHKIIFQITK